MEIKALHHIFEGSTGICTDTRKIEGGEIFFALKGPNFNANTMATKALEAGAIYAVVDEVAQPNEQLIVVEDVLTCLQDLARYHRQQFDIPVIGITGTNGKTTNKELLLAVLLQKYNVLATLGNLNNHIGVPLTLLKLKKTHEIAIIEMGANHKGEIQELCNIALPNYGLITSIGIAHLEGFGSFDVIKKTKQELFTHLVENDGKCFVNKNAEYVPELYNGKVEGAFFFGGMNDKIQISIEDSNEFLKVGIQVEDSFYSIATHLMGDFQADNIINVFAIGYYFDVESKEIVNAIEHYQPKNNRSQIVEQKGNTFLLDAYNANPTSMIAAIESFAKQHVSDKIVIVGDMLELGTDEVQYHQEIVDKLAKIEFEKVVLVGPIFLKTIAPSNYLKFGTTLEAKGWWNYQALTNKKVLLKGSRGIGLEKILE